MTDLKEASVVADKTLGSRQAHALPRAQTLLAHAHTHGTAWCGRESYVGKIISLLTRTEEVSPEMRTDDPGLWQNPAQASLSVPVTT